MSLTAFQTSEIKKQIRGQDDRLATLFGALSDPTRCRTFRLLLLTKDHDVRVTDIAHIVGVSLPAISQHLKILETTGLVKKEKNGQTVYYRVKQDDPLTRSVVEVVLKEEIRG